MVCSNFCPKTLGKVVVDRKVYRAAKMGTNNVFPDESVLFEE